MVLVHVSMVTSGTVVRYLLGLRICVAPSSNGSFHLFRTAAHGMFARNVVPKLPCLYMQTIAGHGAGLVPCVIYVELCLTVGFQLSAVRHRLRTPVITTELKMVRLCQSNRACGSHAVVTAVLIEVSIAPRARTRLLWQLLPRDMAARDLDLDSKHASPAKARTPVK